MRFGYQCREAETRSALRDGHTTAEMEGARLTEVALQRVVSILFREVGLNIVEHFKSLLEVYQSNCRLRKHRPSKQSAWMSPSSSSRLQQ